MKMAATMAFSTKSRMPGVMERVLGGVHSNLLANAEPMIKLLSM